MIVDSSAILAVVFKEPGYETVLSRIEGAPFAAAGAPTLAETGIVLSVRLGESAHGLLERLLDELQIQEIPFGELHWRETVDAFRRFGRGRHTASLNFGDCMAYAMASLTGEALLYVGDDFSKTDLESA